MKEKSRPNTQKRTHTSIRWEFSLFDNNNQKGTKNAKTLSSLSSEKKNIESD